MRRLLPIALGVSLAVAAVALAALAVQTWRYPGHAAVEDRLGDPSMIGPHGRSDGLPRERAVLRGCVARVAPRLHGKRRERDRCDRERGAERDRQQAPHRRPSPATSGRRASRCSFAPSTTVRSTATKASVTGNGTAGSAASAWGTRGGGASSS